MPEFGPCECDCDACACGDHCDRAACATIPDTDPDLDPREVGEYEIAYLLGDYERCPHCGRHWHGLPITAAIDRMYRSGQYEPGYSWWIICNESNGG